MTFQTYKDLEIYQLSHDLAIEIHKVSLSLPKFELYEEGSQLRRSAKSIPVNIVEGFGRRRYKNNLSDFLHLLWHPAMKRRSILKFWMRQEHSMVMISLIALSGGMKN